MADLKTLTQLSEEWKLAVGHLEAAVAFGKVDPIHTYKSGPGIAKLYDPEAVGEANTKFVVFKLEEQQAKERDARRNSPVLHGEMEGLRDSLKGMQEDIAELFTAADDTKATAAKLLEQNKLIFTELTKLSDMLTERFGKLERMVIANCDPGVGQPLRFGGDAKDAVKAGAVDLGSLKTPPEVLQKLADAAGAAPKPAPMLKVVDMSVGGAVMTPAAGAAALSAGAQYGPGTDSEVGTNRSRPPIAILGLDPSHHAAVKKAYSACFDMEFFDKDQVNNVGFATKVSRMKLILMMVHTMPAKPRALEGSTVEFVRVKGSMSALKNELQRQWTLMAAPDLGRTGRAAR